MRRCPVCGKYMKFRMKYSGSQPCVYYECDCGQDTLTSVQLTNNMSNDLFSDTLHTNYSTRKIRYDD